METPTNNSELSSKDNGGTEASSTDRFKVKTACENCKYPLSPEMKFCNQCGAKIINHRLTLSHLFSEAKESFFSLDSNKPLLTFIHLFTKPEAVIEGYINGVRKRYIKAFGYFTIAITLSSLFYFVVFQFFPDAFDAIYENRDLSNPEMEMQRKINETIFENQSILFFLSVPILALLSRLVFLRNKKFNYTEHLIINLYAYSQISIISIIIYFLTAWSPQLFAKAIFGVLFIQIGYYAYVLQKLYKLTFLQTTLKTILFFVITIPIFIVFILIVFIIMIGIGVIDFQQMVEAEKAKQGISYIASSVINWTS